MSRYKSDINAIYISERMQECMRTIGKSAMTTIVAPMGYGKSTAINWFLEQQTDAKILRLNIYSGNVGLFWQSFKRTFANTELGEQLKYMDFPVGAIALEVVKELLREYLFAHRQEHYFFIEDYHLMDDNSVTDLILAMADLNFPHAHIIVASRDEFLSSAQTLALGRRLHKIKTSDLQLNPTELSVYSRRCGVSVNDKQLMLLNRLCEGWFSVVYLNLKYLSEHGTLFLKNENIYQMMNEAFSLDGENRQNHFLIVMSISDEFTLEQAAFISNESDVSEILENLTAKNAFVRLLSDGRTYRIHHILKECALTLFNRLPEEEQREIYNRFALWHEKCGQYIRSFYFYRKANNNSAILRIFDADGGKQLSAITKDELIHWLDLCDDDTLKSGMRGLPSLMRRLYAVTEIPRMRRVMTLLLTAIEESGLPETQKNNMRGDCELALSFLQYNDIAKMSEHHKKASALMSYSTVPRNRRGTWTFGSLSVLMMFHRTSGEMDKELAKMKEAIPHYYKVTDGHGRGAEYIMEAEICYLRGEFTDAQIALHKAVESAKQTEQYGIELCALFLRLRMMLGGLVPFLREWKHDALADAQIHREPTLLTMLDGADAYYHALLGECEAIPEWLAKGDLTSANVLKPAEPVYDILVQQVLLAQKQYVKVAGRYDELLAKSEGFHYALASLYLKIQLACAYFALHKVGDGKRLLNEALAAAEPDGLVMPFAENYSLLKEHLSTLLGKFAAKINELGILFEEAKENIFLRKGAEGVNCLTEIEIRICKMIADRNSNREIAEALFLGEGTVKQYINKIYAKLYLDEYKGDKRKKVAEIFKI